MSTKATATATLRVKVQCEQCRRAYEYDEVVVSVSESWGIRSADDMATECEKDLTERLSASLRRQSVKDLGFKKCP